jgi:hypothetical protein
MSKQPTTTTETASVSAAETRLVYEVLADSVKIGGVIAFRTARVHLTKSQAETLNSAQPDTVRFLGI